MNEAIIDFASIPYTGSPLNFFLNGMHLDDLSEPPTGLNTSKYIKDCRVLLYTKVGHALCGRIKKIYNSEFTLSKNRSEFVLIWNDKFSRYSGMTRVIVHRAGCLARHPGHNFMVWQVTFRNSSRLYHSESS